MIKQTIKTTVTIIAVALVLPGCSTKPNLQTQPPATVQQTGKAGTVPQKGLPGAAESDESKPEDAPQDLLEQALEVYQEALDSREKRDADGALEALDQAYALITKVDVPQDSPQLQEKNDLRLLIAQRIQELHVSQIGPISKNHQTIPLTDNEHVAAEIKSFQTRERDQFIAGYKRSGRYRPTILKELRKAGLPEELSWLPMVESWFKIRAYSRARALGLWQFIASTGYRFGLKRNRWIDERMDPEKASRAAVAYLAELHSFFGDWTTALASYNCGEFRVQRVIRAQHVDYLDNFWDLYVMLPRETARFVPRFIATVKIVKDPAKYGFELPELDPPLAYEIVSCNRPIRLSALEEELGLPGGSLLELNAELRHNATPDREYLVKVPVGCSKQALVTMQNLSRWIPPEATYVVHYVRRGQTVSGIARRYRTTVGAIARLNKLRRNFMIKPGQRLKIPTGRRAYSPVSTNAGTSQKPKGSTAYTVQSGDSPYTIAQKFGMSLRRLLSLNGLRRSSRIYPGQRIWVIPN